MKAIGIIIRTLLGLEFAFFGLNGLLQFMKMPPPEGPAGDFIKALAASHYFQFIAAFQVAGGVLLLIGRFVPLGLLLLGPIIVNILLFHIFLEPKGMPIAVATAVLALIVLWQQRAAFSSFLKP